MRTTLILALLAMVSASQHFAWSATEGRMKVKDLPNWNLTAYDMRAHAVFEPLFTDPNWAPMRPYAFVLENKTPKSIIGLAIDWKLNDADSNAPLLHYVVDGEHRPIARGHSQFVVVPGDVKVDENVQKPMIGPAPFTDWANRFTLAPDPSVSIDVVMLDDGEVAGPDNGHLVDSWIARDRARQMI